MKWHYALLVAVIVLFASQAHGTYKPEYDSEPDAVQNWFRHAHVKGGLGSEANLKLGVYGCCERAERLMTKFVSLSGNQWMYYPDPKCVVKGCTLLPIPDYVVHDEEIRAENPEDDSLPEFDEMREQGILFIYDGNPSCFWAPEGSGG